MRGRFWWELEHLDPKIEDHTERAVLSSEATQSSKAGWAGKGSLAMADGKVVTFMGDPYAFDDGTGDELDHGSKSILSEDPGSSRTSSWPESSALCPPAVLPVG